VNRGNGGARLSGRFRVGTNRQLSNTKPFAALKRHECRAPLRQLCRRPSSPFDPFNSMVPGQGPMGFKISFLPSALAA
jgi:hypothetical protein